jgi:hypothetical protein
MISRRISPYEKWFLDTNEIIQYAVDLVTPSHTDLFVDFLLKSVAACHLRIDGMNFIHEKAPLPIGRIPDSVQSARDAAIWAGVSYLPDFSQRLATIAVRENRVVVSVSHMCSDGVSFLDLTNDFQRGVIEKVPILPIALDDVLREELAKPLDVSRHLLDSGSLSSVGWSDVTEAGLPDDVRCRYDFVELPLSAFQCFDKGKKKLVGFSDALWRSAVLACAAMNPANSYLGCTTCVNLRPFLKARAFGNLFAPLCVVGNGLSNYARVADLDRSLRADFTEKMNGKAFLNTLKSSLDGMYAGTTRSAAIDVSNVGTFNITHPITDVWIQQTMRSRSIEGSFGLLTFAVAGNRPTNVVVRLQSSPTVINSKDAARTFRGILHSLQHIGPEATVRDAVKEIREIVLS